MKAQRLELLGAALAGGVVVTAVLWFAWARALVADMAELRDDRRRHCLRVVARAQDVAKVTADSGQTAVPAERLLGRVGELEWQLSHCWLRLSTAPWRAVEEKLGRAADSLLAGRRPEAAADLADVVRLVTEAFAR